MGEIPAVPWHSPSSLWKHGILPSPPPNSWLMPLSTNYLSRGMSLVPQLQQAANLIPHQPFCTSQPLVSTMGSRCRRWHGLLVRETASQMGLGLWMKTRDKMEAVMYPIALEGCGKPDWVCALIMAKCVCKAGSFTSTGSSWQGKSSAAHAPVSSTQTEQLWKLLHRVHAAP